MEQVGSKYTLATICAKRAKEINAGAKVLTEDITGKPDRLALREIMEGKIRAGKKPVEVAAPVEDAKPISKRARAEAQLAGEEATA